MSYIKNINIFKFKYLLLDSVSHQKLIIYDIEYLNAHIYSVHNIASALTVRKPYINIQSSK